MMTHTREEKKKLTPQFKKLPQSFFFGIFQIYDDDYNAKLLQENRALKYITIAFLHLFSLKKKLFPLSNFIIQLQLRRGWILISLFELPE